MTLTRIQQIERDIRRRAAKIRLFLRHAHKAGVRPFYGKDRHDPEHWLIAVTPDLRKKAIWRVTWFRDGEPIGHTELSSFDEAVNVAVREYSLDLDTVEFAPAARDREAFRPRRTARIRKRRARRPT